MSDASLIHYPGYSMARFGLIPDEFGGGPKYRIIWAPSRAVTLTGEGKTMTVPMYIGATALENIGDAWIIEYWKAPDEIFPVEEVWNREPLMLLTGPFPSKGEWYRAETLSCNPCDANVEKAISWLEAGKSRRPIENEIAVQQRMEQQQKDKRRNVRDRIQNAMRPFGAETMVAYGEGRNSKTYPIVKSAEELGLPGPGQTAARDSNLGYEVPLES